MKTLLSVFMALSAWACMAAAQQPTPAKKPPAGVPADAKFFNGKWYLVYLERASWTDSKQRCVTLGGQLAVVANVETWRFIKSLAQNAKLWIGATDEHAQNVWKWVDDTPFTFAAWLPGQPDHWWGGKEHYVHTSGDGWNDAQDNGQVDRNNHVAGFICEWKDK